MNKRANISIYILVCMVLFTCVTALYLLNAANKSVLAISADVESLLATRTQKEEVALWLKLGVDNLIVKDYDESIKRISTYEYSALAGLPIDEELFNFNKRNLFFLEDITSSLVKQTSKFENFNVGRDSSQNYFVFTQTGFNPSSGVKITITEFGEGGKLFGEEKITQRDSILWTYSAPVAYKVSFKELGLDSYSDIYYNLNDFCSKDSISLFKECLSKELPNWKFDENSISTEKITDLITKQETEYYKINFVSKRIYSQFNPPRPISFTLYVEKN